MAYIKDIKSQCIQNEYFRQVLATGPNTQIVIMSIPPGGEIGDETHKDNDQVLYLMAGQGKAVVGGQESEFLAGDMVLVPSGTWHNFINTGDEDLKIITTYSPPHHAEGTIHKTKAEADQQSDKKTIVINSAAVTAATFQAL